MEILDETLLTPQQKTSKLQADMVKMKIRLQELQKKMATAAKNQNKQRQALTRIDIELVHLNMQRIQKKMEKEQLKAKL